MLREAASVGSASDSRVLHVFQRARSMQKLLTPVDFGAFSMSHRVVVVAPSGRRGCAVASDVRQASTGGLIIRTCLPDMGAAKPLSELRRHDVAAWRLVNEGVSARGGTSVAQLDCVPTAANPHEAGADVAISVDQTAVTWARAAGFDGVELDVAGRVPPQAETPLLETIGAVIDVWGADRLGVSLAPFASLTERNDERLVETYGRLLGALYDLEIAYVRVAGVVTPERGDLSASPLGRHLRKAFPGMLIASGAYTPEGAIAAVNSRWADAVGFSPMAGCGDSLLEAITLAAMPPRAPPGVNPGGLSD
jgi:2,4-dienoyl-CoA reductase-like NADH-dependent reductase (Old Yellow Enzyme family)